MSFLLDSEKGEDLRTFCVKVFVCESNRPAVNASKTVGSCYFK